MRSSAKWFDFFLLGEHGVSGPETSSALPRDFPVLHAFARTLNCRAQRITVIFNALNYSLMNSDSEQPSRLDHHAVANQKNLSSWARKFKSLDVSYPFTASGSFEPQ
jgi:hypothetical protein